MIRYPATYADAHGREATAVETDGATVRLAVRGVTFAGHDFDSLEPEPGTPPDLLAAFILHRGDLCGCRLEWQVPVRVSDHGRDAEGVLHVELVLGNPAPNGWLDREDLRITLEYDGTRYPGAGTSGWFEDELLSVQAALPEGVYFRACITCRYSDYSPYGHGLFGDLLCFRNVKAEYLRVRSKADYWPVLGRAERFVQETFLCPEFERRPPNTGYRG